MWSSITHYSTVNKMWFISNKSMHVTHDSQVLVCESWLTGDIMCMLQEHEAQCCQLKVHKIVYDMYTVGKVLADFAVCD